MLKDISATQMLQSKVWTNADTANLGHRSAVQDIRMFLAGNLHKMVISNGIKFLCGWDSSFAKKQAMTLDDVELKQLS